MPNSEELEIKKQLKDKNLPTGDADDKEVDQEDEEVVVEDDEDEEVEVEEGGKDEMSFDEQQARSSGWKPKDEWDGDASDWVTFKQFNRNGEYLKKIHNQNRQIKRLDDVVVNLAKQQKKIFDAGYDRAKRELKGALREANKEGDDATAEAIETRIEQLEEQRQADVKVLAPTPQEQQVAPEFEAWVSNNQWFITAPPLRGYAEQIGLAYAKAHPDKTNTEIYTHITGEVKKRFPEEFGMNKPLKKKSGSPVLGSGDVTAIRRNDGKNMVRVSLTPEEKDVGRALVSKGIYKNINEYAQDLKKMGVKS